KPHRPCHPAYRARGGKTHESSRQRVAKAPRSRGNPFLRAVARQKFFPPGSLALSRSSQRATVGACKNRSAAPAAPSLLRPLDALGAAAPWGQNLALNRALAAKRLAHSQRQISL